MAQSTGIETAPTLDRGLCPQAMTRAACAWGCSYEVAHAHLAALSDKDLPPGPVPRPSSNYPQS